jgi:RNA polymerase sigma-70 factor (ECF subfamily)
VDIKKTVKESLQGKPGAWDMLVNTYAKRVFNLAYQFAGGYQEAEDLTQDIFLKLYGALSRYDFEKDFTAWFLTLARNQLIDAYRRTKWEKAHRDDFEEHLATAQTPENPEAALDLAADQKVIWESLNLLAPETRMAVILRDMQDRTYEEIAGMLTLPVGTVKSRINRGRIQLAKILKERKETAHDL